jgi:hypothetical protein
MSAFSKIKLEIANEGQGTSFSGKQNPNPCRKGGNCFDPYCFFNHPEATKSVTIQPVKPTEKIPEPPTVVFNCASSDLSFKPAPTKSPVDFSEYLGDDHSIEELSLLEVKVEELSENLQTVQSDVGGQQVIIGALDGRIAILEQEVCRLSQPTPADQAVQRLTLQSRAQAKKIESLEAQIASMQSQMASMQAFFNLMQIKLQKLEQAPK